jgi:hypothetical protein
MRSDPRDLTSPINALDRSELAVGSQAHEASVVPRRGAHRAVMHRTFGVFVASMTQLPYMDTQSGFRAFRGSIAKLLFDGRNNLVAPFVRKVDLAFKWDHGTAILFPCLPPTESRRAAIRLSQVIPDGSRSTPLRVEFFALFNRLLQLTLEMER